MPEFRDFYFPSTTGKNQILARTCTPDKPPKAVVQIAHGIAEHIDRYDPFMRFLAEDSYYVVGNDHLGHGLSAQRVDELGIFAEKDGWTHVVDDMKALRDRIREEHHDIPYIFFGHSMGSFLTRTYMIRFPNQYDAAILSGTGHQSAALISAAYTRCRPNAGIWTGILRSPAEITQRVPSAPSLSMSVARMSQFSPSPKRTVLRPK